MAAAVTMKRIGNLIAVLKFRLMLEKVRKKLNCLFIALTVLFLIAIDCDIISELFVLLSDPQKKWGMH